MNIYLFIKLLICVVVIKIDHEEVNVNKITEDLFTFIKYIIINLFIKLK